MKIDFRLMGPAARLLMSIIFLLSGFGKLTGAAAIQGYMEHYGVPGVLVWPAAAFEIGSGVLLVAGYQLRPLAILLSGWCLLTAAIFHHEFSDQMQMINFLKNLTMAGGFLLLARSGAPDFGVDGLTAQKRD